MLGGPLHDRGMTVARLAVTTDDKKESFSSDGLKLRPLELNFFDSASLLAIPSSNATSTRSTEVDLMSSDLHGTLLVALSCRRP